MNYEPKGFDAMKWEDAPRTIDGVTPNPVALMDSLFDSAVAIIVKDRISHVAELANGVTPDDPEEMMELIKAAGEIATSALLYITLPATLAQIGPNLTGEPRQAAAAKLLMVNSAMLNSMAQKAGNGLKITRE